MHEGTRPDLALVTARQRDTWATGDFNEVARQNVVMAEALCDAAGLRGGQRVLDVGCGTGTAALVAARRYCQVAGLDYVPTYVERAHRRSEADGLEAEFHVGDAQALPFEPARFDAVLSVYGAQFAPDQERTAAEMLRVCRPGGTIALASPMPEGWSGDLFAVNARHAPPPAGVPSPLRWGTEEGVRELLGDGVVSIRSKPRTALQFYRSVEHAVEVFMRSFGPAIRAAEASSPEAVRDDLRAVFERYDRADDGTAVIENTYLLTVAIRA